MIVVFDDSLWSERSEIDPLDLLSVLAACAHMRHYVVLPKSKGDHPMEGWIDRQVRAKSALRTRLHRLLENLRRRAPGASGTAARIRVIAGESDTTRGHFAPRDAARLLHRPLKLLVENARNDRDFLLRVVGPRGRKELENALKMGWIEFEMGGGITEICHRIDELRVTDTLPRIIERARLWVMFDRDAHPKDRARESDESRRVRETAAGITTPWPLKAYQLKRRSIENYIPLRAIESWCASQGKRSAALQRRARVFARLNPEIRHNFNLKKGLLGDLPQNCRSPEFLRQDERLDPLFRGIGHGERELLAEGFKGLAEAFSTPGIIHDNDLSQEVSRNEQEELLGTIRDRM